MATKLVKGTPVVSRADGERLGTIDHVYFDPQRKAVVGFTFHRGGSIFGSGAAGLVDMSDVLSFGPDAVMLSDISVVRSELALEPHQEHLLELEELLNRPVMTESGKLLGHVHAINFNQASSYLSAIDVLTGEGSHRRVTAEDIAAIGADLIIVTDQRHSTRGMPATRRVLDFVPGPLRERREQREIAQRPA